jgi:hypothetical protein
MIEQFQHPSYYNNDLIQFGCLSIAADIRATADLKLRRAPRSGVTQSLARTGSKREPTLEGPQGGKWGCAFRNATATKFGGRSGAGFPFVPISGWPGHFSRNLFLGNRVRLQ